MPVELKCSKDIQVGTTSRQIYTGEAWGRLWAGSIYLGDSNRQVQFKPGEWRRLSWNGVKREKSSGKEEISGNNDI